MTSVISPTTSTCTIVTTATNTNAHPTPQPCLWLPSWVPWRYFNGKIKKLLVFIKCCHLCGPHARISWENGSLSLTTLPWLPFQWQSTQASNFTHIPPKSKQERRGFAPKGVLPPFRFTLFESSDASTNWNLTFPHLKNLALSAFFFVIRGCSHITSAKIGARQTPPPLQRLT